MEALLKRASHQRVINTLDFKRLTANMGDAALQSFKGEVSIIDAINGIEVASLFSRSESILDRAELQGGLNSKDYGALSGDDKMNVSVRAIRLDDTLPSVDVFEAPMITRSKFDSMNEAQKQDVIKTNVSIVDKLPDEELTRPELHEITLRIAQQTKEVLDDSGLLVKKDSEDVTD